MTVPATPAPLDVDHATSWRRLDPRTLLVHPVIEVSRALPALAGVFFASGHGRNVLPSLGIAVIVAGFAVARWFTTRLRITAEHVELKQGVLRRRSLATRRDRIRTVDVTSHLLHRVLGLSRVVIGTARPTGRDATGSRSTG